MYACPCVFPCLVRLGGLPKGNKSVTRSYVHSSRLGFRVRSVRMLMRVSVSGTAIGLPEGNKSVTGGYVLSSRFGLRTVYIFSMIFERYGSCKVGVPLLPQWKRPLLTLYDSRCKICFLQLCIIIITHRAVLQNVHSWRI